MFNVIYVTETDRLALPQVVLYYHTFESQVERDYYLVVTEVIAFNPRVVQFQYAHHKKAYVEYVHEGLLQNLAFFVVKQEGRNDEFVLLGVLCSSALLHGHQTSLFGAFPTRF